MAPWTLIIGTGHLRVGGPEPSAFLMWCPALAALLVCALRRVPLASLGWQWLPARYEWYGYLTPILYALPVYLLAWLALPGSFALPSFVNPAASAYLLPRHPAFAAFGLSLPILMTVGIVLSLARALGEEIGWRGFLLPRLVQRFGFSAGCLLSGLIWAAWHAPILLGADYNAGTHPVYAFACFTVLATAMSYILGWLRLKSGSVWPCAVLHATHNTFIQGVLDPMTASTGRAPYFTTEFGCGLALSTSLFALYFHSRRGELPLAPPTPLRSGQGSPLDLAGSRAR